VECQNLLPDQVLCFVDRLSMAHSVEVRPPFLDPRLIEFAFKLPGTMKIKNGVTKYILKQALRGIIPQSIIRRPKEGFILPYHYWMKHYLHDKIFNILRPERLKKHGFFNVAYVQKLLKGATFETLEQTNKVYLLLMFQLWWEKYWE
jgi:asparagine synthase (glutamine-hydrolysing)